MPINEYKTTDVIMGRVPHGADLLDTLTQVCRERGVTLGTVSLIGAVSEAALAVYDQERKAYERVEAVMESMEIVSASGSVSLKDGEPFVHLHVVLSDRAGRCVAGHLTRGAKVFACEYAITRLEGPALLREYDETTGLYLWRDRAD